jgi:NAD(P)-dependent dehydrogenase (short-subunit alcohol dehydrogenase family)
MPVTYDLGGKTAVVTGGAKGIGRAIVDQLLNSGAQVHVWDLNPIERNSVVSTKVDVTDRSQVGSAVDDLVRRSSRIDILVNDAGYLGKLNAFEEHELSDWDRIIQVNLVGMMQGNAIGASAHTAVGWRAHRQHGLSCGQRGISQIGSLLCCECRRDLIHEGTGARNRGYEHTSELCRSGAN